MSTMVRARTGSLDDANTYTRSPMESGAVGISHDVPVTDTPDVDPRMAMALLDAHEQERSRLAEELHDGTAQALANAIFQTEIVDRAVRDDPDAARAEILALRQMLERELDTLRGYINQLRPSLGEAAVARRCAARQRQRDEPAHGHARRRPPRGIGRRAACRGANGRAARRAGGDAQHRQALAARRARACAPIAAATATAASGSSKSATTVAASISTRRGKPQQAPFRPAFHARAVRPARLTTVNPDQSVGRHSSCA